MVSAIDPVGDLYARIGRALMDAAPAGWAELRGIYARAGKTAEWRASSLMQDGTEVDLDGVSWDFGKALKALREQLYQQGKGAWYTARVVITPDRRLSVDLDYDNEPQWRFDVVPGTYVEDLAMFPRDEATLPEWLKSKLRQAEGQQP